MAIIMAREKEVPPEVSGFRLGPMTSGADPGGDDTGSSKL
jgi:hypothetical protein